MSYNYFELDNHRCRYCGSYDSIETHHVIYRSRGGDESKENKITLCHICHMAIHAHTLSIVKVLERIEKRKDFRWNEVLEYWRNNESKDYNS